MEVKENKKMKGRADKLFFDSINLHILLMYIVIIMSILKTVEKISISKTSQIEGALTYGWDKFSWLSIHPKKELHYYLSRPRCAFPSVLQLKPPRHLHCRFCSSSCKTRSISLECFDKNQSDLRDCLRVLPVQILFPASSTFDCQRNFDHWDCHCQFYLLGEDTVPSFLKEYKSSVLDDGRWDWVPRVTTRIPLHPCDSGLREHGCPFSWLGK